MMWKCGVKLVGCGRPMMKTLALSLVLIPAALLAADVPVSAPKLGEVADKQIRNALPVCSEEMKISARPLEHKLPVNLTAKVVRVESSRPTCEGQWVAATTSQGGFILGIPWFLDDLTGTIEEKLKTFTWNATKEAYTAVVDKEKTRDGFFKVKLYQTTARGPLPFDGVVDPAGTVFFFGHFSPLATDVRTDRLQSLDTFLKDSPSTGAGAPTVTVIEFSDFECPSCMRSASYMKPIMAKHADKVRYVRYDLPLVQMHPWALTAAIAGRAISHQKPELFWEFKEQVYANQEKLNSFVIDDFTRNFAKDHDLDMAKYDAEVSSPQLRTNILAAAGAALSNDVRATPTYMVNGTYVDPGEGGKALEAYVEGLLKK